MHGVGLAPMMEVLATDKVEANDEVMEKDYSRLNPLLHSRRCAFLSCDEYAVVVIMAESVKHELMPMYVCLLT